ARSSAEAGPHPAGQPELLPRRRGDRKERAEDRLLAVEIERVGADEALPDFLAQFCPSRCRGTAAVLLQQPLLAARGRVFRARGQWGYGEAPATRSDRRQQPPRAVRDQ